MENRRRAVRSVWRGGRTQVWRDPVGREGMRGRRVVGLSEGRGRHRIIRTRIYSRLRRCSRVRWVEEQTRGTVAARGEEPARYHARDFRWRKIAVLLLFSGDRSVRRWRIVGDSTTLRHGRRWSRVIAGVIVCAWRRPVVMLFGRVCHRVLIRLSRGLVSLCLRFAEKLKNNWVLGVIFGPTFRGWMIRIGA